MKFLSDTALQERLSDKLQGVQWHSYYYTCICPFHQSNPVRASMFVYSDGYRCASCNAFGSLKQLEKLLSNQKIKYHSDDDEVEPEERPKWFDYKKQYGSFRKAAQHAYRVGQDYPVLMKYLKERKLSEIIEQGKIGYLNGWLSFPVFNEEGQFVDWVLRSTPSLNTSIKYATRPRKNKNESFHLYCPDWDLVNQADEVYVPFGILDTLTLHLCGLPTFTGMTGKTYQLEWFNDIRKKIYLIPDKGEEKDAYAFCRKLGWRGKVLELNYPENCKDPNNVLTFYDKSKVILTIQESK